MRKNLLSTIILSGLLALGTTVSAQSLEKLLKKNSKEDKVTSKSTKSTSKKAVKSTSKKASKTAASKARMTADVSVTLPALETQYYYDSGTETWNVSGYYTNEYDANGNLILQAWFQELDGDTIYKNTYEYDSYGNQIGSYDYGTDGNSNTLVLKNGNRTIYSYDAGVLTEEVYSNYDYANNTWQDVEKTVYVYSVGIAPVSISRYEWDGTTWVELATYVNITWYDFDAFEVKSYSAEYIDEDDGETYRETYTSTSPGNGIELYEMKDGNAWIPVERYLESLDSQGNMISISQEYINNAWVNDNKNVTMFDEMGNYAGYEYYNWVNNAWELVESNTYQNTYNTNNVLVEQVRTSTYNGTIYMSKTVYSEFETLTITSTSNAVASFELKAFPNPVHDVLTISTPNQESAEVRVYNMQNALMQTATIEAGNATINVSNLSAGVYMLQVQTASGVQKTERIVKK